MLLIRRILLATDLEPPSDRAMERAVQLAHRHRAILTVLYAIRSGKDRRPLDNLPPHHIEAEMARHLERIPGAADLPRVVAATEGMLESVIARHAAMWNADMIVVGRSEPVAGVSMTSTAETIGVAGRRPLLAVAAKPFRPYASALVPVDFSDLSRPALEAAATLVPDGAITLLHIYDIPSSPLMPAAEAEALILEKGGFAEDFRALTDGFPPGCPEISTTVDLGAPVDGIIRAAHNRPSTDLIVMGSAGRSGLGRALFGSVAHEVLGEAPCDVLIVPE